MTDVPAPIFVNPLEVATTYRFGLWAASGEGKTVAACSAPKPILALNADRPSAYHFARKFYGLSADDLREMRYDDESSLAVAYAYLRGEGQDVRTVSVDPVGHIYDALRTSGRFMRATDGEVDYDAVNAKILGFITSLRKLDVNVVLIAHERLNDGKKGDGKLYPSFGGPTLSTPILAERDGAAHVERYQRRDPETAELGDVQWIGQIAPLGNMVGKGFGAALGDRRVLDLSRWIELLNEDFQPDTSDLPWATKDGDELAASDLPAVEPPHPDSDAVETAPSAGSTDDAPGAEPTSDAEAQDALRRATVAERPPLDAEDWLLLDLFLAGKTGAEATKALGSTLPVVRQHVAAIKRKMGVRTMPAVLELARKMPREVVVP